MSTSSNAPFGSTHGADRWAAGNMAEVLLAIRPGMPKDEAMAVVRVP